MTNGSINVLMKESVCKMESMLSFDACDKSVSATAYCSRNHLWEKNDLSSQHWIVF